jgi:hypothetical protein
MKIYEYSYNNVIWSGTTGVVALFWRYN